MIYEITVPASTSNLGPGYDKLGLALNRYLRIRARPAEDWRVITQGEGRDALPTDERNLIVRTLLDVSADLGKETGPLAIEANNEIPIERGLGSSSTAIVAGVLLAHLIHKPNDFDKDDLLQIAVEFEGHLDNLAPAILGGLRVCGKIDNVWTATSLPIHEKIRVAVAIPEVRAKTTEMRGVLPTIYSDEDEAVTSEAIDRLLAGLASGAAEGLAASERDVKHHPYRFPLLPESYRIYQEFQKEPFIAGAFLSGAGACVAGWFFEADGDRLPGLAQRIGREIQALKPDHVGVRWHTTESG